MKFSKRIAKLEARLAVQRNEHGLSIAEEIRECRRRRFAAEGRPFEEPPEIPIIDVGGRPLTLAETIRRARFARLERESATVSEEARNTHD